jgi:hypothetical protein
MVSFDVLILHFSFLSLCVDGDVVHVYCHGSLCDLFSENGVHHGLEGCGGVGKSEEHDSQLVQALVSGECSFPAVLFFNLHCVISPPYVDDCEECASSQLVDLLGNQW